MRTVFPVLQFWHSFCHAARDRKRARTGLSGSCSHRHPLSQQNPPHLLWGRYGSWTHCEYFIYQICHFPWRFPIFAKMTVTKNPSLLTSVCHTRTVAREFFSAWVFASYLLRVLECRVSVAAVDTTGVRFVHPLIDLHKLLHQSDLFSQHVI